MVHFLDGVRRAQDGGREAAALGLVRRPLHRTEQRGRHLQVQPVRGKLPVRPCGEPVLALAAVRRRLHEDAQQRETPAPTTRSPAAGTDRRRRRPARDRASGSGARCGTPGRRPCCAAASCGPAARPARPPSPRAPGANSRGRWMGDTASYLPGIAASRAASCSGVSGAMKAQQTQALPPLSTSAAATAAPAAKPFALIVEAARPGEPDRLAARNRVALRRRLLQRPQREALGREAQVHIGHSRSGSPPHRRGARPRGTGRCPCRPAHSASGSPWRRVLPAEHDPAQEPLLASPPMGVSRRCVSTPNSNFTFRAPSTPRPLPTR